MKGNHARQVALAANVMVWLLILRVAGLI